MEIYQNPDILLAYLCIATLMMMFLEIRFLLAGSQPCFSYKENDIVFSFERTKTNLNFIFINLIIFSLLWPITLIGLVILSRNRTETPNDVLNRKIKSREFIEFL